MATQSLDLQELIAMASSPTHPSNVIQWPFTGTTGCNELNSPVLEDLTRSIFVFQLFVLLQDDAILFTWLSLQGFHSMSPEVS